MNLTVVKNCQFFIFILDFGLFTMKSFSPLKNLCLCIKMKIIINYEFSSAFLRSV